MNLIHILGFVFRKQHRRRVSTKLSPRYEERRVRELREARARWDGSVV